MTDAGWPPLLRDSPCVFPAEQKQEGLKEAISVIGCPECESSEQGCRHCWPAAVALAAQLRGNLPVEQRIAAATAAAAAAAAQQPEAQEQPLQQEAEQVKAEERQQEQQEQQALPAPPPPPPQAKPEKPPRKQSAAKAARAAASPSVPKPIKEAVAAAAAAAGTSPAIAAALAASGAGSSSSRRNKALLAVQREAVTGAHEVGKYALGCGRCRYSMTGGCGNCRAKSAEVLVSSRGHACGCSTRSVVEAPGGLQLSL